LDHVNGRASASLFGCSSPILLNIRFPPVADFREFIDGADMSIPSFFNHAVEGWGRRYPRSKYVMGLGLSLCGLVAISFEQTSTFFWLAIASAIAWLGFYLSAFIVDLRTSGKNGDLDYDRRGKYKLSKEYHDSESATSAKAERRKSKR
jgi:hypothetical protein